MFCTISNLSGEVGENPTLTRSRNRSNSEVGMPDMKSDDSKQTVEVYGRGRENLGFSRLRIQIALTRKVPNGIEIWVA
jgi:hypothetical protein